MSAVLHVQVEGEVEREFWREQQAQAAARGCCWVPHSITMALCEDGSLSVVEGEEAVEDCKVSLGSAQASGEPVCVVLRAGECSVRAGHGVCCAACRRVQCTSWAWCVLCCVQESAVYELGMVCVVLRAGECSVRAGHGVCCAACRRVQCTSWAWCVLCCVQESAVYELGMVCVVLRAGECSVRAGHGVCCAACRRVQCTSWAWCALCCVQESAVYELGMVCVVLRAGECSVRAGHGGGPREGRLDGGSGKPDLSHQSPSLLPHQETGTVSLPTSACQIAIPDSWTCCASADPCQVPVVSLQ